MSALLASLLLFGSAASPASNQCGGAGPWCIDRNYGPHVAGGYVAYMHDGGDQAPGALYAILQTQADRSLSVRVGAWGCATQAGGYYEDADWLELSPQDRVERAGALLDRSVAAVVESCGADPSSFSRPREGFDEAFRLFDARPPATDRARER